jgi:hypothetical protein
VFNFRGTATLVFTNAFTIFMPAHSVQGLHFVHILHVRLFSAFSIAAVLRSMSCCLLMVCISLIISDVEHLSMGLLVLAHLLWRNIYSSLKSFLIWIVLEPVLNNSI